MKNTNDKNSNTKKKKTKKKKKKFQVKTFQQEQNTAKTKTVKTSYGDTFTSSRGVTFVTKSNGGNGNYHARENQGRKAGKKQKVITVTTKEKRYFTIQK